MSLLLAHTCTYTLVFYVYLFLIISQRALTLTCIRVSVHALKRVRTRKRLLTVIRTCVHIYKYCLYYTLTFVLYVDFYFLTDTPCVLRYTMHSRLVHPNCCADCLHQTRPRVLHARTTCTCTSRCLYDSTDDA